MSATGTAEKIRSGGRQRARCRQVGRPTGLAGTAAKVRDIKIRATRIVTNDNIDILVPNSEFVSGRT